MRVTVLTVALCSGLIGASLIVPSGRALAEGTNFALGAFFRWPGDSARGVAPAYSPYISAPAGRTETPLGAALSAEEIARHLTARGFTSISGLRRKGGSFLCEATGPRRERVRLVVNAVSGEISGMEVIGFKDKRY